MWHNYEVASRLKNESGEIRTAKLLTSIAPEVLDLQWFASLKRFTKGSRVCGVYISYFYNLHLGFKNINTDHLCSKSYKDETKRFS